MKKLFFVLVVFFVSLLPQTKMNADDGENKLRYSVHEWGVMQIKYGYKALSTSKILDELPSFVHKAKSKKVYHYHFYRTLGGGKPIIYFYANKPLNVNVTVKITSGTHLCWWPKAETKNKTFKWSNCGIDTATKSESLRPVSKKHWFNAARDVDSSVVTVGNTKEKFLFYETKNMAFEIPFEATGSEDTFEIINFNKTALKDVFIVKGKKFIFLPEIDKSAKVDFTSVKNSMEKLRKKLLEILIRTGLFRKEAKALLASWEPEFFKSDKIRIIYSLPRAKYDELLPIKISPKPLELVRTGLVLVEQVNPVLQKRIDNLAKLLTSTNQDEILYAQEKLIKIGKPAYATLKRLAANSKNPSLQQIVQAILKKLK